MEKSSATIPRMLCHLRRRAGIPASKMHESAAPPTSGANKLPSGLEMEATAVVFTVRVVCATVPLMVAEVGMLHVAGLFAALGEIAQLRRITPVNPPVGVNMIVEVFPEVAPRTILIPVPVMVKLGGGEAMV